MYHSSIFGGQQCMLYRELMDAKHVEWWYQELPVRQALMIAIRIVPAHERACLR